MLALPGRILRGCDRKANHEQIAEKFTATIFSPKDTLIPCPVHRLIRKTSGDIMRDLPFLIVFGCIFLIIGIFISPYVMPVVDMGSDLTDRVSDLALGNKSSSQPETMAAKLILNNMKATRNGTVYSVTGDVTNGGKNGAKNITVTTERPAVPVGPHRIFAAGTLNPFDFSSFEVTFSIPAGTDSVPILVTYNDMDGKSRITRSAIAFSRTG